MCESITILMSLFRSKNMLILLSSLCVPMFEPLRFVEVIVILLAEFDLEGFIVKEFAWGHLFHEHYAGLRGGV